MLSSIVKITDSNQLCLFVDIIRVSFQTVADQYGLTESNSPTNPAFTTMENLNKIASKADCFGVYINTIPSGFFALEFNIEDKTAYLERVCVLPELRHKGLGQSILQFAENYCKNLNIEKISIGIMNRNEILKEWYKQNGFIETSIRQFPHIKFDVCFLENRL
jgi:ribosomal protein S18 acetylase RimI-like enzyme